MQIQASVGASMGIGGQRDLYVEHHAGVAVAAERHARLALGLVGGSRSPRSPSVTLAWPSPPSVTLEWRCG
jgi:hypothetical protein